MQRVIIDKPYTPVPPHRGRLWPAVIGCFARRVLRKKFGVTRMEITGLEHLRASLRAGHGILLAPNHCRDEDPVAVTCLCRAAGTPAFTMASAHLFLDGGMMAYLLPRAGAFSVYREGIDRPAIATAIELLAEASRPLVVFPEGFISRTNDRLSPLQEGVAFIARNAARKRAKLTPPGRVVVHPVAIRYHFLGDCEAAAATVLEEIETRLTWPPQRESSTTTRIQKAGQALLALKEMSSSTPPKRNGQANATPIMSMPASAACAPPSFRI
jgi:1-acyl-sn-glycerol-3-phosphate acyltransferase